MGIIGSNGNNPAELSALSLYYRSVRPNLRVTELEAARGNIPNFKLSILERVALPILRITDGRFSDLPLSEGETAVGIMFKLHNRSFDNLRFDEDGRQAKVDLTESERAALSSFIEAVGELEPTSTLTSPTPGQIAEFWAVAVWVVAKYHLAEPTPASSTSTALVRRAGTALVHQPRPQQPRRQADRSELRECYCLCH